MKIQPLAFPSVADIEAGPEIKWSSGDLSVEFRDWRNEPHHIQFIDVPHFELLDEGELDSSKLAYDGAVEVIDSPLVASLVEGGGISTADSKSYRHLVIGFNEIAAFLVVVCRTLNLNGEGAKSPRSS